MELFAAKAQMMTAAGTGRASEIMCGARCATESDCAHDRGDVRRKSRDVWARVCLQHYEPRWHRRAGVHARDAVRPYSCHDGQPGDLTHALQGPVAEDFTRASMRRGLGYETGE
jgi:hypothetical protein